MAGGKADTKVERQPTMNAKNNPVGRGPADAKESKKELNQIQQGGPQQQLSQQPQQQQQQQQQQQHGGGGMGHGGGGGMGHGGGGGMGHGGGGMGHGGPGMGGMGYGPGGGQRRPFKRGMGGGGNLGNEHSNYMNRQRGMPGGNQNLSIPGPTTNLQTKEGEPKKFTGRCRLFVGNLTPDIDESEFRKMFEPYGTLSEVFLNAQKGFGFVKMDTRANAEMARTSLDGTQRKGRVLRVRFATHGAALRVRNLASFVSNELLELAFSLFGEVERAVVIVDDRGKPTGDGIVEFARKPGAQMALKRCTDGAFLLTASPRPVIVEPLEQKDDEDGYPEKILPKNSQQYLKERDLGPRFAQPGSFEYEFSLKWKQLYELEKQKRESLEKDISLDRERLDDSMEFALYEHETNILREKLRQREQDATNLMREREMRRHERLREDEERQKLMRQHDEYNMMRNDELRRRQEDTLLMQANHLNSLLDQQEAALRQMQAGGVSNAGGNAGGGGANGNSGNVPVGRGGPAGPLGGGSSGPAGPVMGGNMAMTSGMGASSMGSTGLGGQNVPAGQGGMNSGQMPRQSRFDQSSVSASAMMGQGPNGPGPGNHMNRGMGAMGPQMGGPMGDMRGAGMGRRELMERRDHRDDYVEAKRRRY